tara:strand:+ start:4043 stop:4552 length:510 start_codon:yes stop_codon:yes gene_type:complete
LPQPGSVWPRSDCSQWNAAKNVKQRPTALHHARENLGVDHIDVVADRDCYKIEDIEDCEAAGVTPYVPKPLRSSAVKNGFFTKEQFHYDANASVLICPSGEKLEPKYKSKIRDNDAINFGSGYFLFEPKIFFDHQPNSLDWCGFWGQDKSKCVALPAYRAAKVAGKFRR